MKLPTNYGQNYGKVYIAIIGIILISYLSVIKVSYLKKYI